MATRDVKCHFDLNLNSASCRDMKQMEFRITTLKLYLIEHFSPLQLAIRNLIGVIYYYSGQYHKAYENFSEVLKGDCSNLNALENIARVCFRLQNTREEGEFRQKYDEVVNNRSDISIRARFRAEHAYAHAFECYIATNELRRYHESNDIYIDCLNMTSEIMEMSKERAEWKMCMVWNYKKLFNRNFTMDQLKAKNEDLYPKILETLYDILDLVPSDEYFSCLVYGYLGYFSWKRPISPNETSQDMPTPEIVKKRGMEKVFRDPELCFRKALEIREELEVMQLFVGWLQTKKLFDECLLYLNKCVDMKPTHSNYFSYSKRGEALYGKANMIIGKAEGTLSLPVKECLDKAISDFEFVATVNPTSYLFAHLGLAYCLRSDKGNDRQMKANCLAAFERGLVCLDGRNNPFIHSNHSQCLKTFGEDDQAMQATKRGIECQFAKTKYTLDIEFLLGAYIEKMASDSSDVIAAVAIDAIHWFCVAFYKYDRPSFKEMFTKLIIKHCHELNIALFSQMLLKQDSKINQFFVEVFQQQEVKSACEKHFDAKLLCKMFSTVVAVEPIKALSHSKNLQARNRSGFSYDFFVIYSNDDRDWVLFSLVSYLENTRGFKGFLDHRDFKPGQTILSNIDAAISNSFKSILVITPNFLKSGWCQHESQAALTDALNKKKAGFIIPIVKDGAEIPDFLKTIHGIYSEESFNDFEYERLANALDSK